MERDQQSVLHGHYLPTNSVDHWRDRSIQSFAWCEFRQVSNDPGQVEKRNPAKQVSSEPQTKAKLAMGMASMIVRTGMLIEDMNSHSSTVYGYDGSIIRH